jgi:hypothetical protein
MTSDIYTSLFEMSCYFFIEIIYILAENMYLFNEFIWKTFESFSTTYIIWYNVKSYVVNVDESDFL